MCVVVVGKNDDWIFCGGIGENWFFFWVLYVWDKCVVCFFVGKCVIGLWIVG